MPLLLSNSNGHHVHLKHVQHAKYADETYIGFSHTAPTGPCLQRLVNFGQVTEFVLRHHGEASSNAH